MFDIAPTELLLLGAVAVAVIPPKDLPRAMRFAGQWIGKARGMARHFRSGLDEMIRQSELEEIERKWREENERIMREHPLQETIEHSAGPPVMTALPTPEPAGQHDAYDPPAAGGYEAYDPPATAENGTELPPPLPVGNPDVAPVPVPPAPPVTIHEAGPELPLGLPPKQ